MNERTDRRTAIIAVPVDTLDELERAGLAYPLPVLRGGAIEAFATVGMDAAALVTLLQTPDSVRSFAAWVRGRFERSGDSIEVSARRGNRRVRLIVDHDVDIVTIADFLKAALAEYDSQP